MRSLQYCGMLLLSCVQGLLLLLESPTISYGTPKQYDLLAAGSRFRQGSNSDEASKFNDSGQVAAALFELNLLAAKSDLRGLKIDLQHNDEILARTNSPVRIAIDTLHQATIRETGEKIWRVLLLRNGKPWKMVYFNWQHLSPRGQVLLGLDAAEIAKLQMLGTPKIFLSTDINPHKEVIFYLFMLERGWRAFGDLPGSQAARKYLNMDEITGSNFITFYDDLRNLVHTRFSETRRQLDINDIIKLGKQVAGVIDITSVSPVEAYIFALTQDLIPRSELRESRGIAVAQSRGLKGAEADEFTQFFDRFVNDIDSALSINGRLSMVEIVQLANAAKGKFQQNQQQPDTTTITKTSKPAIGTYIFMLEKHLGSIGRTFDLGERAGSITAKLGLTGAEAEEFSQYYNRLVDVVTHERTTGKPITFQRIVQLAKEVAGLREGLDIPAPMVYTYMLSKGLLSRSLTDFTDENAAVTIAISLNLQGQSKQDFEDFYQSLRAGVHELAFSKAGPSRGRYSDAEVIQIALSIIASRSQPMTDTPGSSIPQLAGSGITGFAQSSASGFTENSL